MTAFLRFAALGAAGVAGAGTASASTAHRGTFCTAITAGSAGFCAIAEGASQPVRMLQDPQQNSSPTTWAYPIQGGYQQILNGNLSLLEPLCMQLDHAKSNEVIEARCVHVTYQEWAPSMSPRRTLGLTPPTCTSSAATGTRSCACDTTRAITCSITRRAPPRTPSTMRRTSLGDRAL